MEVYPQSQSTAVPVHTYSLGLLERSVPFSALFPKEHSAHHFSWCAAHIAMKMVAAAIASILGFMASLSFAIPTCNTEPALGPSSALEALGLQ